jgi:UDP-N-acetylmuramoylalanine--D-glutamate ligase
METSMTHPNPHVSAATDWSDRPLTVLGLSRTGASVARYVQCRGGRCFLSEVSPASPTNEAQRQDLETLGVDVEMGGHSEKCFNHADTIVVSPGIPPSNQTLKSLQMAGKEIISEVELAYRESRPIPLIGITGTNGKTTTTTLIGRILEFAGKRAPVCGNIGTPIIEVIDTPPEERPELLVAELSSFQLHHSPTLTAKIAVLTSFTPDHLDWHGSLDAYRDAKLRLFTGDQSPEWAVVHADCPISPQVSLQCRGQVLLYSRYMERVAHSPNHAYLLDGRWVTVAWTDPLSQTQKVVRLFDVNALQIFGAHNHENVLASVCVALLLGISPEVITEACLTFAGVEHRLERVRSVNGVTFYNDSKATNPESAISALRSFNQMVVLIAGGKDKMTPLEPFVAELKRQASRVVLIGQAAQRFAEAMRQQGYQHFDFAPSLEEAVSLAYQLSQGEPVLFSPACASFDMFRNYEERGRAFKAAVDRLSLEVDATPNATPGSRAPSEA